MATVQGMSLFARGGYTGPGGVNEPAGIAHKGEVYFSQSDVRRHGGVAAVETLRVRGGGYADRGGSVTSAITSGAPVQAKNGGGSPRMAANSTRTV